MYFPFTTAKNLIGFGPEHEAFVTHMDRLQMILVLAIDQALARNRVSVDRRGNPTVDYRLTEEVLDSLYASMQVCTQIFFAAGAQRVNSFAAPLSDHSKFCNNVAPPKGIRFWRAVSPPI